jgi:hypothetical protein
MHRIEWRTMMLNKLRIALAAIIMAVAAVSAADPASAIFRTDSLCGMEFGGGLGGMGVTILINRPAVECEGRHMAE